MGKARKYHQAMTHYIRRGFTYDELTSGAAVVVGTLPAGAVVLDACAVVKTAFNSATSDVGDIGTPGDPDGFATDLDLTTAGKISADELATSDDLVLDAETDIHFTWTGAGAAPSAGEVEVIVQFAADNDR